MGLADETVDETLGELLTELLRYAVPESDAASIASFALDVANKLEEDTPLVQLPKADWQPDEAAQWPSVVPQLPYLLQQIPGLQI